MGDRRPREQEGGDRRSRGDARRGQRGRKRGGRSDNRRSPLSDDALFKGRRAVSMDETEFKKFFLDDNLLRGVAESGYGTLTPLQEKMILPLMERKDVIAQASSGSGKTAAYLIPILHTLSGRMGPRILIVTPTRDLAIQAYNEVRRLAYYMDKHSVLIDPGSSINAQAKAMERDPDIVIGTPGRLLDHIKRGNMELEDLDCLVLDEVDRILDHGQRPDVEAIEKKIRGRDQTLAISSTISPPVLRLCRHFTSEATELFTAPEKPTADAVRHSYFRVKPEDKIEFIYRLLEREQPERAIIFCRSKVGASRVTERIRTLQGGAMELHMGILPRKQEQIIKRFREKEFNLLVTTDTFTQDLDVENISHIINFDIPEDPEDYVFRIGKTACMGGRGRSMTLVSEEETELLEQIEKFMDQKIEEEVLAGLEPSEEPEPKHEARPRIRPETHVVPKKREEPFKTPEPPAKPKVEYFHGGWHRKRPRRGRR